MIQAKRGMIEAAQNDVEMFLLERIECRQHQAVQGWRQILGRFEM